MLLILSVGILVFVIMIMHFLMPKVLIEKYFKPPHFKSTECTMFSGFPFAIMRTIMFYESWGFLKVESNEDLLRRIDLYQIGIEMFKK